MKNKIVYYGMAAFFLVSAALFQVISPHPSWGGESQGKKLEGGPQAVKAEPVVRRVQEWYDKLTDLQADFRQKSFSQTLNTTTEARGKIYFKKPNLMKWDYESPEKQIYVINQKDFWWYVPEDAQVVKRKASTVLQDTTPLSFLSGLGNLQQSFIISLADGGSQPDDSGVVLLNLVPRRAQANIKKMQLKLEARELGITGIILVDPYGNTNDIDFLHLQRNQGLADTIFHFVPPRGVEVIDEDVPDTGKPVSPVTH
ncbi:MAG: outer membrane lipoprotein chaperone LolA [bacterium]